MLPNWLDETSPSSKTRDGGPEKDELVSGSLIYSFSVVPDASPDVPDSTRECVLLLLSMMVYGGGTSLLMDLRSSFRVLVRLSVVRMLWLSLSVRDSDVDALSSSSDSSESESRFCREPGLNR